MVPLKVSYFFIEDDDDESLWFVPKVYDGVYHGLLARGG